MHQNTSFVRIVENCYPLVGGLAVGGVYLSVGSLRDYVMPDTISNLLAAVVSVGGIAVGFLATAKSILIAVDDRPIVERMKEAKIYRRVLRYFRAAIFWSFLLTVVSVVALFFDYKGLKQWDWPHAIGTSVWLAVAAASVLAYHRIARIWYGILDVLDTKSP